MRILLLNRENKEGRFSFEELFTTIRQQLQDLAIIVYYNNPRISFLSNLKNIRKITCDVIHITGGVGYYSLFLNTQKTILTIHDTNHYEFDLNGIKKILYGWIFFRLPIKNVKFVTVVSEHTKANLIRFFNADESKIKVIPNCYSPCFKRSDKTKSNEIVKILHIGTKPNKNLNRIIEAIKELNVELVIIGKLQNKTKELLRKYNITFSNKFNLQTDEIYQEYINCDIVEFVSLREGFGMPIIEANCVGRPVITSNISSMPEIAGDSAILVNPYDVIEIKNGILKLIKDDFFRMELINRGFKNAQRFNPTRIGNLYKDLYSIIN